MISAYIESMEIIISLQDFVYKCDTFITQFFSVPRLYSIHKSQ